PLAVAAPVGRHPAVAGARKPRQLVAPRVPELGEPVAQDHRPPLALLGHVQHYVVRGDPAVVHPVPANATARARRKSLMCPFTSSGRSSAIQWEPPSIVSNVKSGT